MQSSGFHHSIFTHTVLFVCWASLLPISPCWSPSSSQQLVICLIANAFCYLLVSFLPPRLLWDLMFSILRRQENANYNNYNFFTEQWPRRWVSHRLWRGCEERATLSPTWKQYEVSHEQMCNLLCGWAIPFLSSHEKDPEVSRSGRYLPLRVYGLSIHCS